MRNRPGAPVRIQSFDLQPGRIIARKYRVMCRLGTGWEGEVYGVVETRTGVERAAKLFYPQRNVGNRTAKIYAKKLHKLRHSPLVIQYHTEESITLRRTPITVLVSEYVEGELLSAFLRRVPGRRLGPFEALHLLYPLAKGMEQVHAAGEYHGDIHSDNIIVNRYGLGFRIKLLDLFHLEAPKVENKRSDICDVVAVLHEALGGAKYYARQPRPVKHICCGLKRGLILRRFRTMSQLRRHLDTMTW